MIVSPGACRGRARRAAKPTLCESWHGRLARHVSILCIAWYSDQNVVQGNKRKPRWFIAGYREQLEFLSSLSPLFIIYLLSLYRTHE
jgi:hypothetical protein